MARKININQRDKLVQLLPGYNCGICGYARCDEFAASLLRESSKLEKCRFMFQELFDENREKAETILKEEKIITPKKRSWEFWTAMKRTSF